MFELSLAEMAVIGITLLLVIGPEDMPAAIRGISRFVRMVKDAARDMTEALREVAEESGVEEIKKQIHDMQGEVRDVYDMSDIRDAIDNPHIVAEFEERQKTELRIVEWEEEEKEKPASATEKKSKKA